MNTKTKEIYYSPQCEAVQLQVECAVMQVVSGGEYPEFQGEPI